MGFRPELSWEFLSRDEIYTRSLKALRNHIQFLKDSSPFYQTTLRDVDPDAINSIEDLRKLPFTNKNHLVSQLPSFRAMPAEKIVETVATSGTTSEPLVFILSASDLERLTFSEALSFWSTGITDEDRVQILVSLDRLAFTGMAYYRGLTALGVNTVRIGVLPLEMHKHLFHILKPTALVGIPSFLKKIGTHLCEGGINTRTLGIKKILCTGESIRLENLHLNSLGKTIQELFDASIYSTYCNTEISVSYCECAVQQGNHSHPELVFTEIIDEKGAPVPDGTPGELVTTTFGVEGIPLLRYCTGDITFRIPGQCACGRNSDRIGPILGRKSQLVKVKGTTVFPSTITLILDDMDCVEDYIILVEATGLQDEQLVVHAVTAPVNIEKIAARIRAEARVSIPILVSNHATLKSYRTDLSKKQSVIDKRDKKRVC